MYEALPITIKDAYPIDIESGVLSGFPREHLESFKDEAEKTVESILAEFGVHTEEDVQALPLEQWTELRRRLLEVNIRLYPSGEVSHE